MRKTITSLAVVTMAATGLGILATGTASAAPGCIWLDGNRPEGSSVTVAAWTFTCQADRAGFPQWYPDAAIMAPQPQPAAAPSPAADQPDPGSDAYNAF